jgi:hypothetical protein
MRCLEVTCMDLFHLGALGHLMWCVLSLHLSLSWKLTPSLHLRLYAHLDPVRPQDVAESIAAETIQMLHALVAQFTCSLMWHVIVLCELDFARCTHTKVFLHHKDTTTTTTTMATTTISQKLAAQATELAVCPAYAPGGTYASPQGSACL